MIFCKSGCWYRMCDSLLIRTCFDLSMPLRCCHSLLFSLSGPTAWESGIEAPLLGDGPRLTAALCPYHVPAVSVFPLHEPLAGGPRTNISLVIHLRDVALGIDHGGHLGVPLCCFFRDQRKI